MVSIHSGVSDGEVDAAELPKQVKRIEDKSQYKKAVSGDLVFNMMRAWQGAIGTVRTTGMVSPAYIVAEPNDKAYPLFMLQHYGSSTRCMDFVDNHWIALWFGLYQWVSTKNEIGMPVECFYKKRTLKLSRKDRLDSVSHIRCQFFNELKKATSSTSISESQSDVNQLIKNYSYKLAFAEDQYLYLLLFVADTLTEHETTQHSGIYSNSRMTVVDLRT